MTVPVAILLGIALFASAWLYGKWRTLRRAEFIRTFRWPRGLLERLEKHHAGFERKDSALVSRGLRQFFLAYLMSGKRHVSMPSQVADDLWHEFILYTRDYDAFCRRAFGGFLHHTPAAIVCARQQVQERQRVRLSARLQSAAQERQRRRVLRRRFLGYVVRRQLGRVR